jgi:transcription initiation factor TFIIIB Brf1 subunit/transcription initiation factor TFIIB
MTAIIYIACIAADSVKTLQEIYKTLDAEEGLIKKNIEKINKLIKSDYHSLKEKSLAIPDFLQALYDAAVGKKKVRP